MAFENTAGIDVYNHYGPRFTGGAVGVEHSQDNIVRLSIDFTGRSLNEGFIPEVVIPKYAHFLANPVLTVHEVFVVSGTTPTILFGAAGSVATNGFIITEAELEAAGTKKIANDGEGTWDIAHASGTAAAAAVAFAFEGDAACTNVGRATLTVEYVNTYKA